MGNFKIVRKGYSQIEVDEYISRLINDYETRLSEQKDRIFYLKDQIDKITNSSDNELVTSLVSAVERAKLIENSSKNIYELETKKLNLLYGKMESLLNNKDNKNNANIKEELLNLIKDCRKSLQTNISMQNENMKESVMGDPVKRLLEKMMISNNIPEKKEQKNTEKKKLPIIKKQEKNDKKLKEKPVKKQKESSKLIKKDEKQEKVNKNFFEKKNEKQPKVVVQKKQENKEDNEFNDYLSKDKGLNGGNFANIMFSNNSSNKRHSNSNYITKKDIGDLTPNESGFDLKAAVNPKEDLEDIMKAFDFYNDNKKKR